MDIGVEGQRRGQQLVINIKTLSKKVVLLSVFEEMLCKININDTTSIAVTGNDMHYLLRHSSLNKIRRAINHGIF